MHKNLKGCMDLMLPAVLNCGFLVLALGERAGFSAVDALRDSHRGLCLYILMGMGSYEQYLEDKGCPA